MVLPDSDGISRVPPYSGSTLERTTFQLQGLLPSLAGLSRPLRLYRSFVTPYRVSYNPKRQASWFGLFRSPLLRNRICFLFLRVLRCFSSPGMPSHTLCIQVWILLHYEQWVSPFGNLGSKLAYSSRSISVFVPSFIGS